MTEQCKCMGLTRSIRCEDPADSNGLCERCRKRQCEKLGDLPASLRGDVLKNDVADEIEFATP